MRILKYISNWFQKDDELPITSLDFKKRTMEIHKTEILHQTDHGYVMCCTSCKDIQLGFGNMLLVYPLKGFKEFKKYIDDLNVNTIYFDSPLNRNIYMKMDEDEQNFGYCISKEELIDLKELIDSALNAISVKKMLHEVFQKTS